MQSLELTDEQRLRIKDVFFGNENYTGRQVIKDADVIAFFADERLQTAFKKWADGKRLADEPQRKLDKINKLRFDISRKIANPYYLKTKSSWKL